MVYLQRCLLADIAGATLNCCRLGAFRGHHTTMRHMSRHFMQSHIRRVHAYLRVTCHLLFWQNDLDLLRATALPRGWNGYRTAQKVDPGKEHSPAAPAGTLTRDLSITSPAL